jgi:hypothetical protein
MTYTVKQVQQAWQKELSEMRAQIENDRAAAVREIQERLARHEAYEKSLPPLPAARPPTAKPASRPAPRGKMSQAELERLWRANRPPQPDYSRQYAGWRAPYNHKAERMP